MFTSTPMTSTRYRWRARRLAAACVLVIGTAVGPPAAGQGPPPEPTVKTSAPEEPKLQVHGFLTQAYARSDGNKILGIDEDGTNNYRTAALQLRYQLTERDSFALQLAHEGLGESPLADLREDVELDWVFYRRQLSDATELKAGKVPIPLGLYNEILDVGTVLPLYRPPTGIYGEGAFVSETVEGVVLSHTLFPASDWPLDVDLYYGGWEILESDLTTFSTATAEDGVGFQFWLRPPVPGLRVGLAGQQFLVSDGILRPPGVQDRWQVWHGSFEWLLPRLVVRAEYVEVDIPTADYASYYGQAGIRLTSKLTLHLQAEWAELTVSAPGFFVDLPFDRDRAVGLSYAFRSSLVAKLEAHRNEGYRSEDPAPSFFGSPVETTYGIVSLSVSF